MLRKFFSWALTAAAVLGVAGMVLIAYKLRGPLEVMRAAGMVCLLLGGLVLAPLACRRGWSRPAQLGIAVMLCGGYLLLMAVGLMMAAEAASTPRWELLVCVVAWWSTLLYGAYKVARWMKADAKPRELAPAPRAWSTP